MTVPLLHRKSIVEDYTEALEWLKSFGINYSKTRFAKYEKYLTNLEKSHTVDLESYDSVVEASDLILIFKGFAKSSERKLAEKLKIFIEGPIHSSQEKPNGSSHKARNIGLELLFAAHFLLGGFKINFETLADAEVTDKETLFHVECKRPFSLEGVENNISEAYDQLKRRYENYEGTLNQRGVAVLSLSKILNWDDRTLQAASNDEVFQTISSLNERFLTENKPLWYKNLDNRTIGVFAYFQMAFVIKNRIGTGIHRQFNGIYVSNIHNVNIKNNDPDRLYFHDIVARLNSGAVSAFQN